MPALGRSQAVLAILLSGHATVVACQDSAPDSGGPLIVNLERDAGSEQKETVAPGTYEVRIINRAPGNSYSVTVLVRTIPIPPLAAPTAAAPALAPPSGCKKTEAAIEELRNTKDETRVSELTDNLEKALTDEKCEDLRTRADSVRDATKQTWKPQVILEAGQEVDVTVTRPATDRKSTVTWKHTFSTQPRGEWRLSYGFATVFPLGFGSGNGLFGKPASYFAKAAGSGTYVVTKQTDRSGLDVVPVVGYTFMSTNRLNRALAHSLTAGLGIDLKTPTGIVAYALTYNQNVTLSFGLGFHSEPVLRGTFAPGETITTNLTPDDLNNNKFRVRPVFMLTLRSLKNPFSAPAAATATEKGKEKPSEGNSKE